MVITKQILSLLENSGQLDRHSLYMGLDDTRVIDRIAMLVEREDIQPVERNRFRITDKGKKLLHKLL